MSAAQRYTEAAKRYNKEDWIEKISQKVEFIEKVEQRIFSHCSILPTDIHDESITPLLEELRGFDIV